MCASEKKQYTLKTIFTSTYPIDLYAIKGRLETEGIHCFIKDENIINVHPFYSNAVGGAKLTVPDEQYEKAKKIISEITNGEFKLNSEQEFQKTFEELELRSIIRNSLNKTEINELIKHYKFKLLTDKEIEQIIQIEKEYINNRNNEKLTWEIFWSELIDGNIFKYIKRNKTVFYLEEDLITKKDNIEIRQIQCPECKSENVKFGYSTHVRQGPIEFLFTIIFSFLFCGGLPFPKFRKRYHCFECNKEFKRVNKTPAHD